MRVVLFRAIMRVQQAIRFWIARRSVMRAILGTKNGVTGWYQDRNSDSVAYCIVELDSDGDEVLLFSSCFLGCLSSSLICRLFFFTWPYFPAASLLQTPVSVYGVRAAWCVSFLVVPGTALSFPIKYHSVCDMRPLNYSHNFSLVVLSSLLFLPLLCLLLIFLSLYFFIIQEWSLQFGPYTMAEV